LDQGAFIGLVVAGTEAYRRECYGVLLGYRHRGMTYVQEAIPYQTALRKPLSVFVPARRRKILERVLRSIPRPRYLGEFHSHVGYGDEPPEAALSVQDILGARDRELQILISIQPRRATFRWRHNSDGSLSGSAGPYFLKMRAFQTHHTPQGKVLVRVATLRSRYAVTTANSRRVLVGQGQPVGR